MLRETRLEGRCGDMIRPRVHKLTMLYSLGLCVAVLLSQPVVIFASPAQADSVHFCGVFDYEQWLRDNPPPAGKRAADLNVGQPRTVRMIYFLPNDRPFRQEVVDSMKTMIRRIQSFYLEQMQAHGHGDMTFRFETDAQNDPVVHHVDGQHPESYYQNPLYSRDDLQMFNFQENIYFIFVDVSWDAGIATRYNKKGGQAFVSGSMVFIIVAHEFGHAFGLPHDFRDDAYIMSYGWPTDRLSACSAEFLSVHPYFNPDIPIEETLPPTVELISPRTYPAGSESISIRLKVGDADGLHQVFLLLSGSDFGGGSEVKACRGLSGERDAVVEFEYDGRIPSYNGTDLSRSGSSLSDPKAHPIEVRVVDTEGDIGKTDFVLVEFSPHHIGTLEGHTAGVGPLAVSPDGGILASGASGFLDDSKDTTLRLWDVASREEITILHGHTSGFTSVTFSPDGALLAAGSRGGTILLWDVASRKEVGILKGHKHGVWALAFSPDGTLLASGATDFTVRLWDVVSRTEVGILKEYSFWVTSAAFSPNGALLATGSYDGAELWDVASRKKVVSLSEDGVRSMGFSRDGNLLATGMLDDTVRLWDMASRTEIGNLKDHTSDVYSVAFSRDGNRLASGSGDSRVILWDVLTGKKIVAFPNTGTAYSVVFLSDDAALASGGDDGDIALWDVSKWTALPALANPDFDGDGDVGFSDFLQFAARFGLSKGDEGYDARFDLDTNGTIGFSDFLIFAGAFGSDGS